MRTIIRYSLIIIVLYFVLVNITIYYYASTLKPAPKADTMIVLGAQIIDNSTKPGKLLQERLDIAIDYLKRNPETKVVVCGGLINGKTATEASVMQAYLMQQGIDSARIYQENQSTRTAHQFIYPKRMMDLGSVVVATSDFHMLRSMMLAKRSGLDKITALPSATSYSNAEKYTALWREPLALANSWLFDYPR
ncbi:uncharacterized SAM-binding protein YcdF (DUF218 family) [Orbus hercynius]|uniref:Uncharacterized SAM-binding protein YcdF (DUF218 family) n=1 Tax=Orbus hercynius TaxID=593135 RepID=A0A495RC83_9GAMM|nr:YdcF family protein [Orbus hercynius]RKS85073.1 uncharacterized SAM-binding protein YcdF (DUF218 family) [Orbus hercynius]